ncbi:gliding motility-associated C-terminal domain-containing protein [Spirosoma oryzicola]|uniref:gliding motility-associated C-terminal domain-containing protein n=1 Tax=Spirosoma oryzicola TaxID=2898794 RepID=UPI001E28256B|nr:gliding motility-associated C-terminal domain-containing protein [Spirosoma oryzicola]UHG92685.1 gliding motility-associated C-terminal domain-containing protein [Spirosoma oryzicola]
MRTSTFLVLLGFFTLTLPLRSRATHQVGGQLEMKAVGDVPGHFKVIVTNYLEDGTQGIARQSNTGNLGIFRKRDNTLMLSFTVRESAARQRVIYSNEYCAEMRNLKFVVFTYEGDIQLTPSAYTDSEGYYMSYQTRNRNAGINNISDPSQIGFTFYLEFPALQQNGTAFNNSSPRFAPINGEYLCLGEPFTFPFSATDPDGDELRYSLVTPLDQKGSGRTGQNNAQSIVSAGPYPDVTWLSGFNATNAIPGSPSLSINERTGQLSVTASQLGLFVFAVKVEEYRNGVKIGEVRRDFQFLVVDCPPSTVPDPTVQLQNRTLGLRDATICRGDSIVIQATANTSWNYQWRRNGINLANATKPSLTIREAGEYTVVVSQKVACSKTGNSEPVTIRVVGAEGKLFAGGHLCATTGSVQMKVVGSTDAAYQWYQNGQPLSGKTADSITVSQPGNYWVALKQQSTGCVTRTDTFAANRSPAVQALIQSATGSQRLCPQSTMALTGSGGISYSWQKDGQLLSGITDPTYTATTAGVYSLTATDTYGCTGTASDFVLEQIPPVTVTLDSIADMCGTNVPMVALQGSPPGGEYAGVGVAESEFNAQTAGVGNHVVTYTVKAAPECPGTVATRRAIVAPVPTIQLTDSLITYKGNTFTFNPVYTGNPNQFQWVSSTYLDNDHAANPTITNILDDITYTIAIQNSSGCEAKDTIHVTVFERVWVPDAFTPNGDGMNDVLRLPGIEAFPDAVVTIFNRWGEVVYLSKNGYKQPFDGTSNGNALPTGVYPYTLRPIPNKPSIEGRLLLLRDHN